MTAVAVESTTFCICGCGQAVEQVPMQLTHRFYASERCAGRALGRRFGYVRRIGAVHTASTTTGDTTMAKKSTKKAAAKKATAAPTGYTKAKLDVQDQCTVGATFTYQGINKAFKGKKVTVTGHESRGGVFIKLGDKTLTCSPFALLGRPDAPPKGKGTKAAKKASSKATAAKTKATPKAKKKAPPKPTPATKPAAPAPVPAAPAAPAKATGKAA